MASNSIDVWWPTDGVHLSGVQPLKALVAGVDVSQYDMFWQVDGGTWNWMDNNYSTYQHKETSVNLSQWTWHGSGPYVLNFIARQNGTIIAQQSKTIYVDNSTQTTAAVSSGSSITAPVAPTISSTVSSLGDSLFYVDPNSAAAKQAAAWASSNPNSAAAMQVLAAQPTAVWFGNWNTNIQSDVHTLVGNATAKGKTALIVSYNIPERDCGGFSSGGSNNPSGYKSWISALAAGIGSGKAVVILEPDALSQISCLSSADQQTRLQLLAGAVSTLKQNTNTKVYVDAGHSQWIDAATMARELKSANVAQADGFSLNVSNFMATNNESSYGAQVSALIGGKHFVIDTSRNGNGSNGQWCNPSGMAIGNKPNNNTGNSSIDAFLWVKVPGESDGTCNGGPSAGNWWADYALGLVQNAH